MPSRPSRKRNQADTKTKLLAAALDIFSKDGYDAATTRHIAKKAGVNESLIHRYFKSKLGLFLALKQQFRENFIQQFLSYDESSSLEEELIRFLKARLHSSKRDKKFFRLVVSRAIVDPKVRGDIRNYASMKPPALVERFESFRRKGQIRTDADLDQMISILHALSFAFSMLLDALECLSLEDAEKMIKTAANTLVEGLCPRSK